MITILDDETRPLYSRALSLWGDEAQRYMVVEEIGELLAAIVRHRRGRCVFQVVAEEIADVTIMLGQLTQMLAVEDEVNAAIQCKLERLRHRLEAAP